MVGDEGGRIGGDARSSPFLAMVDKEDVAFTIGSSASEGSFSLTSGIEWEASSSMVMRKMGS
jgi:hypothetical protein